ncbi:glycerophosphodiester phosphodiesterase [Natrialba aegyptia]|uniref:Glycerophosphoryl diester phosphodiesterase n=1 Tax=Natrialba aegyptia DSM 13077 TaxID=1227491 RepID=M0BAF5_9EURY|nr:glycerophosphodiester phosphodiesterase [Natrialba aegyptia]ELZ07278.1 glycerophosphoryl diester phosphodiesterase [Natrialba aegyptia DSM 13077]
MAGRQPDSDKTAQQRHTAGAAGRRTILGTIGAVTGLAVGTVGMSDTGAAREGDDRVAPSERSRSGATHGPHLTAHRGYADIYPENTVAAVAGASRLRADRIEIDIQPSADGEIVVFHDEFLDDLTDETGRVAETPAETVLGAEVLESGETVPTLAAVLDAARPNVTMNIEFKDNGDYSWQEVAERTLSIAADYPGEFYVSSFQTAALEAVRNVDPSVSVAKLFGSNKDENLQIARELDAEAVNPSLGVLDTELVETAHEEGRAVNVYTVDTWQEARRPLELGVDGLIADYPSVLEFGTGKRV